MGGNVDEKLLFIDGYYFQRICVNVRQYIGYQRYKKVGE